jgi:hypothetical protein
MSCGREAAFSNREESMRSRLPLVCLNVERRRGKEQKMTIKVDPIVALPHARKKNGRNGPRRDKRPRGNTVAGLV